VPCFQSLAGMAFVRGSFFSRWALSQPASLIVTQANTIGNECFKGNRCEKLFPIAINHIDRATLEAALVGYEAQRGALMKRTMSAAARKRIAAVAGQRTVNPGRSEGGTFAGSLPICRINGVLSPKRRNVSTFDSK